MKANGQENNAAPGVVYPAKPSMWLGAKFRGVAGVEGVINLRSEEGTRSERKQVTLDDIAVYMRIVHGHRLSQLFAVAYLARARARTRGRRRPG